MHVIFLAKDNHTDNPTFLLFLELGMSRGHTVQAWNKKTFLASDLSGVDVVCLKSYIDDHQVWKVIESQGVRAINSRAASEHCLERLRLDMLLGAGGVRTPRYASSPNEVTGMSYPIIRKPNAMFAPRELRVFHKAPAEIDCKRYFYQELISSDGATYKGYGIGTETFLVKELNVADGATERRRAFPISGYLAKVTREVGKLTGLEIYGVDFVGSPDNACLVDVNPFPSFRALPQAAEVLWAYLEKIHLARSFENTFIS